MVEYNKHDWISVILERIEKDPIKGCWLWTQSKMSKGYAQFTHDRINYRMHIVSFKVFKNTEIEGELHHKCEVRHCVNPDHLRDVSPQTNQKYSKGWTLGEDGIWSCKREHRMEGYNVKKAGNGGICCRECSNLARRNYSARR